MTNEQHTDPPIPLNAPSPPPPPRHRTALPRILCWASKAGVLDGEPGRESDRRTGLKESKGGEGPHVHGSWRATRPGMVQPGSAPPGAVPHPLTPSPPPKMEEKETSAACSPLPLKVNDDKKTETNRSPGPSRHAVLQNHRRPEERRRDLHTDQKRPSHGPGETFTRTRRDLHTDQKRPSHGPEETFTRTRRDLHTDQKRPSHEPGETFTRTRRDLHTDLKRPSHGPEETFTWTRRDQNQEAPPTLQKPANPGVG